MGLIIYVRIGGLGLSLFDWLNSIGVHFAPNDNFPSIKYGHLIIGYIPDILWTFSFISVMLFIWRKKSFTVEKLFWVITPLIIAFLYEIGQKLDIVNGTFDKFDFLAYFLGANLSILLNIKFNKSLT